MRARATTAALLLAAGVTTLGCAATTPSRPAPSSPGSPSEPPERSDPPPPSPGGQGQAGSPDEVGLASWYGKAFAGRPTSSGERFDPKLLTAAHKKLPFGTWVEVRRVDTGRSVRVRINDRGPNGHAAHRIIDLSERAATELDMKSAGVVRVELRIVRDSSLP
jgi:rare lipoprotein A